MLHSASNGTLVEDIRQKKLQKLVSSFIEGSGSFLNEILEDLNQTEVVWEDKPTYDMSS